VEPEVKKPRGRPKAKKEEASSTVEIVEAPKKQRGRPSKKAA